MRRFFIIFLLLFLFTFVSSPPKNAYALGECGLSCCIAGAAGSGATLAENFGISLLHEHSYMETVRNGTNSVSPTRAILDNQMPGMMYSVPTEMVMEKYTFVGVLPINERFKLLTFVPYVINDMKMKMRSGGGMYMDMEMDTIRGLGDISVMGLYTLYTDAPVKPEHRLSLGLGVKTPTGKTDALNAKGGMVHAMMQPGSGSWDPFIMVNYMRGLYPLILQVQAFYQMTTEGRDGYEFGDQLTYDIIARYQLGSYVNLGLELNGIHAGRDKDHDGKYSNPVMSMLDNTGNTGLDSIFLSPSIQVKIPKTAGSLELKYQHPIHQDVNGYQQVLDWRVLASLSFAF
jgi:hypothetical protein